MPIYEYQGQQYDIATEDRAAAKAKILNYLESQNTLEKTVAPTAPVSTERTFGEAATDVLASPIVGLGGLIQQPGQLYGLVTGDFSKTGSLGLGEAIEKYGQEMKSTGLKEREARRDQAVAEAEKTGQWAAFKKALGTTVSDPALFFSFLLEQAPQLIPAIITGGGTAALTSAGVAARATARGLSKEAAEKVAQKAAIKAGTIAAVQTGAIQQGADIGAGTYDEIFKELSKTMPPEQAAAETINKARAAGVAGYALSVLANRFLPGSSALERVIAGERTGKGRLTGAAIGALKEIPSENVEELGGRIAQNIAAQSAGLDRDLTSGLGQTAAMATLGAAGMGSAVGAVGGGKSARRAPREEQKTGESVFDQLTKEQDDVGQIIPGAGRTGDGMAGKPGARDTTGELAGFESTGVVSTGQDVGTTVGGEGQQPGALTRKAVTLEAVSKLSDEQLNAELNNIYLNDNEYALVQAELAKRQATSPKLDDFVRQYQDLRSELISLASITRPTEADTRQMKLVSKDLSNVVSAFGITDPDLNKQLTNPLFDGTRILSALADQQEGGQARAMQGEMFGSFRGAARMAQTAMAASGNDPVKAVQYLEDQKRRYQEKLATGGFSDAWAMGQTGPGMSAAEAIKNKQQLAEQRVAQLSEQIDQAIIQVQRQPRAMQGSMFDEGPSKDEAIKPISQDAQTQDMLGESTDPETQARMEAARKSAEIEKRNKGRTQVGGVSLTPQERLDLLTAKEADLANRLERTKTQKVGSSLGVEEKDIVEGLQNELRAVRRDMQTAQDEIASGRTTPAPRERAVPVKVESTQEQMEMGQGLLPKNVAANTVPQIVDGKVVYVTPEKTKKTGTKQPRREESQSMFEDDEEFGAPIPGETFEEPLAEPVVFDKKGKPIKAPEEDFPKEINTRTVEGQIISDFFDAIKSASDSIGEQKRHIELKNVASETMLEYDIVKRGETTSTGAQSMLRYLDARVGGKGKLRSFIDALRTADPDRQAELFRSVGLPNLTSRRGMEQFRDEVGEYVSQLSGKETGVGVPKSGVYVERIKTGSTTTQTFGKTSEGKPREPSQSTREIEHTIVDNKLGAVLRAIRQSFNMGLKLSPKSAAAMTYLNNLNRKTFGEALSALAYDLAYYELDREHHNADYMFQGEGGEYAEYFRDWIKTNLSPSTLEVLNDMIEQHKQSDKANKQYHKAIADYRSSRKFYKAKIAEEKENQRSIVEKRAARKIKRISERITETETTEQEETADVEVSKKNLPSVQMLTEVHPDIVRRMRSGNVRGALELVAQAKGNPYYAALAQRLLDSGFTATSRLIQADVIESLSTDPQIDESLRDRINGLNEVVRTLYPEEQGKTLIRELKSAKLRNILSVLAELQTTMPSKNASASNLEVLESVTNLINKQYAWTGKYDPITDTIVMREGAGHLNNHLLLHESLHAATSHLLDNPKKLTGVQLAGYNRLMELYDYSKSQLQEDGTDKIYGLRDIHEFVSEALTNPIFQAQLRALRYKASPYSLMNQFTDAIRRLFNIKKGYESDVMAEAMFAADAMMAGTMSTEGMNVTTGPKAMATKPRLKPNVPKGMPNQPSTLKRWMQTRNWESVKREWRSINATMRPAFLGALTLRQLDDLVAGRIPQIKGFIKVTEAFLARKSQILDEAAKISRRWEKLQSNDPEMSLKLGAVMHAATLTEVDPDVATTAQRNSNVQLMQDWKALDPEAKAIYREARNFFERRYSEYKRLMNQRIIMMRQYGVSDQTILEIRNEFEKGAIKGPYFPLMRHGRFWYQVGRGTNREYYMFESAGARDKHLAERIAQDPYLEGTIKGPGNDYAKQMDLHARESAFIKDIFNAVENADFSGLNSVQADLRKQELKDSFYQTYLQNQPDRSIRNQFIHRNNIEGFSQDALRNFASASFNMAYQLSRFQHSPEMFSQLDAARDQLKRRTPAGAKYSAKLTAENDELRDIVKESDLRLNAMLNPPDTGAWVTWFSNIGFIYYLTSVASAVTNVLGGAMIGIPTLVGQQVRANPKIGYTRAVANVMSEVAKTTAQVLSTGFGAETSGRVRDFRLLTPSLERSKTLTKAEKAAYNRFVADGLIDITAAYDQSGLASAPTENYSGVPNKAMQTISFLFHHAERFNREVIAMSAFRSAMEKRTGYADKQKAFAESIAEAKDVTTRSMFDYSAANKPRYMQHPLARVILQFKQFPQQMTFFLARNAYNSFKGLNETDRREARARFVGTMGMAGIMAGVTGMWGFSTVAAVIEAIFNLGKEPDDEEYLDFELEFMDWLVNTFGKDIGMLIGRGAGNAAGFDLASKLKLDGMWIPDGRQNQDAEAAMNDAITKTLGPFVGIAQQGARAYDLYKKGQADRALEAIMPSFIRQPLIAYRYSKEGATNLRGDAIVDEFSPFELAMQSLGFRTSVLAEQQYYNITKKGQEQGILKKRQQAMDLFGLTFMTNDGDGMSDAIDQIMKFNEKHPTAAIEIDSLLSSIEKRLEKSLETEGGLYVDERLRHLLTQDYIQSLR